MRFSRVCLLICRFLLLARIRPLRRLFGPCQCCDQNRIDSPGKNRISPFCFSTILRCFSSTCPFVLLFFVFFGRMETSFQDLTRVRDAFIYCVGFSLACFHGLNLVGSPRSCHHNAIASELLLTDEAVLQNIIDAEHSEKSIVDPANPMTIRWGQWRSCWFPFER